jgi:hypothetical protein
VNGDPDSSPPRPRNPADVVREAKRALADGKELTLDTWAEWSFATALENHDASQRIANHSRVLVRLTWVLIGLTAALALLTAVLVWRTF